MHTLVTFVSLVILSVHFSIKSSHDVECGVIIVDIIPNSAAHNAGLKV